MTDFARTHARTGGMETSYAAAEQAESLATRQKATILAVLKQHGPLTSHEISNYCDLDPHRIMKRVSDLANDAQVRDSGARRPTKSGRMSAVWEFAHNIMGGTP